MTPFLPMKIIHDCIRARVMFVWGGHIVDWKWDWWLERFNQISTERSDVENCIMVRFNCILDCSYFHGGIAKSHFCFKSEIGAANGISWHLDSSRVELSTKLVFWGLIVVSSDRGGWGDHSGPLFMSIRGWGEESWTIYCWETVGEYLRLSNYGYFGVSAVNLDEGKWEGSFCADEICWNFDMMY